jgi:3-isopropylmalate/(R)-2-methylmalate dehydratase small subunit
MEYGFRVVIAPSFADIFYGNCFKNGLLPLVLDAAAIESLFARAQSGLTLTVNLEAQTVRTESGDEYHFDIAPGLKEKLLSGMDDIAMTLSDRGMIERFEERHRAAQPWLFDRQA